MKLLVVFFLSLSFPEGRGLCRGAIYWPLQQCYYIMEWQGPQSFDSCRNRVCPAIGTTLLANVMNKEMNDIAVQECFKWNTRTRNKCWLDLTESKTESGKFRWGSMPNFEPHYFDWAPGELNSNKNYLGVQLTKEGWKKAPNASKAFCLCQSKVSTKWVNNIRRPMPLAEGRKPQFAAACQTKPKWTDLFWITPDKKKVVHCQKLENGVPDCKSLDKRYEADMTFHTPWTPGYYESRLVIVEGADKRDEGLWRCVVKSGDRHYKDLLKFLSVLDVRDQGCRHEFRENELEITCVFFTSNGYSDSCEFHYRYGTEAYNLLNYKTGRNTRINAAINVRGMIYHDMHCSLFLSYTTFEFRNAQLDIQVIHLPARERTHTHRINLDQPIFTTFLRTESKYLNGYIMLEEGDEFNAVCFYPCAQHNMKPHCSGFTPLSLSMDCDFPVNITGGGAKFHVYEKMQAVRDMDDKKCYCHGMLHDTIAVRNELHFIVKYPAEVIFFTLMNYLSVSSTFDIQNGSTIQLGCRVRGRPQPSVTLRHVGSSNVLETNVTKGVVLSTVEVDWSSEGEYICEVRNWFQGEEIIQQKTILVNVKSPPAPCSDEDDKQTIYADVNDEAIIQLCLHAKSGSDVDSILLYSATSSKFLTKQRDYNISVTPESNFTFNVTLALNVRGDIFGKTWVYYNRKSILEFYLRKHNVSIPVEKEGPLNASLYLRILDAAIVLVCLALFFIIIFVMRKRWQAKFTKVKRVMVEQIQQNGSSSTESTVKYVRQKDESVSASSDAIGTEQDDNPVNTETSLASEDACIAICDTKPLTSGSGDDI